MNERIQVRPARESDLERLVEFNAAMARETEELELDRRLLARGVAAVLADPGRGGYLVAEGAGEMVGQLLYTPEWSDWRNAFFWWIQSVYVHPRARRSGVFRALCEDLARRAGARDDVCGFRLYVAGENRAAQEVYGRLGMVRPGYLMYEAGREVNFPRPTDG